MTALSDDEIAAERPAFEAWAKEYGRIFLNRDRDGYQFPYTQEAWVGWKARALLAAQPAVQQPAEDAELLDWLEEKHYALHPIKEDQGDDTYTLWWQVTDKDKSISGHPLGNIRAAIRAARAAERKA